jgi:Effector-associated domain 4/NACHT domain
MTKIYFSDRTKTFTRKVFEALLTVAYLDKCDRDKQIKLKCEWSSTRQVKFEISKGDLKTLVSNATERQFKNEIQPAIVGYLSGILGILTETGDPTGSGIREFSLDLWDEDKDKNLTRFDDEWDKKANEHKKSKPKSSKSSRTPTPSTPQIDWLDRSRKLLAAQKHLTTNGLLKDSTRNFDHIHVPLGLIERKERPKGKEVQSSDEGSQIYHPVEYVDTKRFEQDTFLSEVVGKVAGKHIAIIGEPGAGKTTILTKIGEYLIQQAEQQPEQPFVVAWVSLASLDKPKLSEYFYTTWLTNAHPAACPSPNWKDELVQLVEQRRVWLLLDGLDEMSGDALGSICIELRDASWAQNLRVVMTCRINQWEAAAGGNILTNSFDVYRTLDYSYQTSQGEDQVEQFISNWFGDKEKEVANQIRRELDAPGKERIRDLVKNPLRLTLLCESWEQDRQALPETQAELYQRFVNYLYGWKAREFKEEVKLKDKLNLALGELAKAGLNRVSINDGAVRRFRFTASEIREVWQDLTDTFLPAAKNLVWLNVVGEEAKEDLYAFYHPTFQEYFAACSIDDDDWDYFLPRAHIDRPVPCQSEDVPTYRVFEQEWRQVMLYWIGRTASEISGGTREEFIKSLTNFQRQEGSFYSFRAYCMAAILVGEFKSCRQAESIVAQIIKFAFGHFNSEKKQWESYSHFELVESSAKATIPLTHRQYSIQRLQTLLEQHDSDNNVCNQMWEILEEISPNRQMAKQDILEPPSFEYYKHPSSLNSEEREQRIEKAITILNQNVSNNYFMAIKMLGEIAVGHEGAIEALTTFIGKNNRRDRTGTDLDGYRAAVALGKIAVGNESAIKALIGLLQDDNVHHNVCSSLFIAIGTIVNKSEMSLVIGRIKKYITREALESNFHRFKICHVIILQCAQSLTYPEFYKAWHQREDPASLNLEFSNDD